MLSIDAFVCCMNALFTDTHKDGNQQ